MRRFAHSCYGSFRDLLRMYCLKLMHLHAMLAALDCTCDGFSDFLIVSIFSGFCYPHYVYILLFAYGSFNYSIFPRCVCCSSWMCILQRERKIYVDMNVHDGAMVDSVKRSSSSQCLPA